VRIVLSPSELPQRVDYLQRKHAPLENQLASENLFLRIEQDFYATTTVGYFSSFGFSEFRLLRQSQDAVFANSENGQTVLYTFPFSVTTSPSIVVT
jgi:hypothetical protein